MIARQKAHSARAARRAVDTLAQLGPDALAAVVEAAIDRLDAAEPDPDLEPERDACPAQDLVGVFGSSPPAPANPHQPMGPLKGRVSADRMTWCGNGPEHQAAPDTYALELKGDCLEPEWRSGDMAICSPTAPSHSGAYVVLWFADPNRGPLMKRLVSEPLFPIGTPRHPLDEVVGCVVVELFNPPRTLGIRVTALKAMHRVVAHVREMDVAAARIPKPAPVKKRRKGAGA